jgi:hypothetical protein
MMGGMKFSTSVFRNFLASALGWALVSLWIGCDAAQDGPPLVPAEGAISLNGKPLPNAEIMFEPRGETPGQALFGRTNAEGKFAVASPDGKRKGAPVGNYHVVINKLVKPDGSDFVPDPNQGPMDTGGFKELLPANYSDTAQSQLTADVPEGGTKNLEFKLTSKAK